LLLSDGVQLIVQSRRSAYRYCRHKIFGSKPPQDNNSESATVMEYFMTTRLRIFKHPSFALTACEKASVHKRNSDARARGWASGQNRVRRFALRDEPDMAKETKVPIAPGDQSFPNHSLKPETLSPLTATSCFVFGIKSSLSFPAEIVCTM
jgi:hypothetical protein